MDSDNIWVSPDDIDLDNKSTSPPPISVTLAPGSQEILVLHRDLELKLRCQNMEIRYGINRKFVDHRNRPKFNVVVYASEKLCRVLEICDSLAARLSAGCGSHSEWQPVVQTRDLHNPPTVRLNVPFVENGDIPLLAPEIYQKDNPSKELIMISSFDATELNPLLKSGNLVDADFSLQTYDYNGKAGIKLVAEKLIVHS